MCLDFFVVFLPYCSCTRGGPGDSWVPGDSGLSLGTRQVPMDSGGPLETRGVPCLHRTRWWEILGTHEDNGCHLLEETWKFGHYENTLM